MQVSIHEAQTHLSRLLDLVAEGEEIIIERHGQPIARLVSSSSAVISLFGAMQGEFDLPEGWDRPLTEAEADAFWQGKW